MDEDRALERFRELLRIPTVSRLAGEGQDPEPFAEFPRALTRLYPAVFAELEQLPVDGPALLYRWPGRDPAEARVLMAHWDVVPADEPGWRHPPFGAVLTDDRPDDRPGDGPDGDGERRLWGRGAIDDKGALAAILEALDDAIAAGVVPEHDVYLEFGGDEEVLGTGAQAAARTLAERGVRPALVLDEGGAVVEGQFPGVAAPTAVIGIAEKGIATVVLTARSPGGHASAPPRSAPTATARLARAVARVSRPAPAHLPPPAYPMFAAIGDAARGLLGLAYRHPRLLEPVLLRALDRGSDEAAAMIRTTRVVTRLQGAAADNVLPESATARVNLRIAVGSTLAAEVDRIRRDIADPDVEVTVDHGADPSPVSPAGGPAWETLVGALGVSHPDAVAVPYAMMGASDGRHLTAISDHVYRFTPFELSSADLAGLHAIDESIRVAAWRRGIRFYRALLDRF